MSCPDVSTSEAIPGIVVCFISPSLDLGFLLDFLPDFLSFVTLSLTIGILLRIWRKNPLVAKPAGKTFIISLSLFMLEAFLNAVGELMWFTSSAFVVYRYFRFTLLFCGQVLLFVSLQRVLRHSNRMFGIARKDRPT